MGGGFRKGRGSGPPVPRADALAFVAAEEERRAAQDGFLLFGERLFFLGEIGPAGPGMEAVLPEGMAGAGFDAAAAVSAGALHGCIRRQLHRGEQGADGEKRAVFRMDETAVGAEEAQPVAAH